MLLTEQLADEAFVMTVFSVNRLSEAHRADSRHLWDNGKSFPYASHTTRRRTPTT